MDFFMQRCIGPYHTGYAFTVLTLAPIRLKKEKNWKEPSYPCCLKY